MKLEQTIQLLYDMWGEDILTRKHALNALFLLEGSGDEWIDGELCNTCHDYLYDGKYNPAHECIFTPDGVHVYKIRPGEVKYAKPNPYYTRKYAKKIKKFQWHGQQKDSNEIIIYKEMPPYLFNFPKDIKPDWKAGIEETLELIKQDGLKFKFM